MYNDMYNEGVKDTLKFASKATAGAISKAGKTAEKAVHATNGAIIKAGKTASNAVEDVVDGVKEKKEIKKNQKKSIQTREKSVASYGDKYLDGQRNITNCMIDSAEANRKRELERNPKNSKELADKHYNVEKYDKLANSMKRYHSKELGEKYIGAPDKDHGGARQIITTFTNKDGKYRRVNGKWEQKYGTGKWMPVPGNKTPKGYDDKRAQYAVESMYDYINNEFGDDGIFESVDEDTEVYYAEAENLYDIEYDKYNSIYEYLQNEVENEDLAVEDAEELNNMAYEKYVQIPTMYEAVSNYESILSILQEKVDNEELTLEEAEEVNNRAYEKYVQSVE